MIDRELLDGFGIKDEEAVVTFVDGRALHLLPEWRGESVRRIRQIRLYESGKVIAQVEQGIYDLSSVCSQKDLGAYCAFAIELEREVYRFYRTGKISEEEWQKRFRGYWKVVIKSRQIAAALEQERLPVNNIL